MLRVFSSEHGGSLSSLPELETQQARGHTSKAETEMLPYPSAANKIDKLLLLFPKDRDFHGSAVLCFTETGNSSWITWCNCLDFSLFKKTTARSIPAQQRQVECVFI